MREAEIKTLLVKRLLSTRDLVGDAVLINEFTVEAAPYRLRRADLVVANGHLHAFEVKSAGDTLARLDGQIQSYLRSFDKVSVVAAPCHAEEVATRTPLNVAIFIAETAGGAPRLRLVRRGRQKPVKDKAALVAMLRVDELRELLLARDFAGVSRKTRDDLVDLAVGLPCHTLRAAVLAGIKARYRESFARFKQAVGEGVVTPDALQTLRAWGASEPAPPAVSSPEAPDAYCAIDLNAFRRRWGYIPEGMPERIRIKQRA